jgi:hypothetical protein
MAQGGKAGQSRNRKDFEQEETEGTERKRGFKKIFAGMCEFHF